MVEHGDMYLGSLWFPKYFSTTKHIFYAALQFHNFGNSLAIVTVITVISECLLTSGPSGLLKNKYIDVWQLMRHT